MSLETIKKEVEKLSGDDRLSLMTYLAALRHDAGAAYRKELAGELDNPDPSNWIPLSEVQRQLRELDAEEAS